MSLIPEGKIIQNFPDIAFEKGRPWATVGNTPITKSDGGGAIRHRHVLCVQNSPHASRYGRPGASLCYIGILLNIKIHRQQEEIFKLYNHILPFFFFFTDSQTDLKQFLQQKKKCWLIDYI